jgi:hypothetical protein
MHGFLQRVKGPLSPRDSAGLKLEFRKFTGVDLVAVTSSKIDESQLREELAPEIEAAAALGIVADSKGQGPKLKGTQADAH